MVCTIALAMVLIVLFLLGTGPLDQDASVRTRTAAGVLVVGGATLGLAVLGAGVRPAPSLPRGARMLVNAFVRALPTVTLFTFGLSIVTVERGYLRRYGGTVTWLVMWTGFAIACVYVLWQGRRYRTGLLDPDRAVRVVLPATLLAIVASLPLALGRPVGTTLILLGPAILVSGMGMGVVVFSVFIAGIVGGLEALQGRGQYLARSVQRRRALIPTVLGAKLITIAVVWWLWRLRTHDSTDVPALTWSLSGWLAAAAAAAIVVGLLAINGYIDISVSNHPVVTRYSGLLVGCAVGIAVGTALVFGIGGAFGPVRPRVFLGVIALVALGALAGRLRNPKARVAGYLSALTLAAIITFGLTPLTSLAASPAMGNDVTDPAVVLAKLIFLLALIFAAVWLIVSAIRRRQSGWLTYLLTVVAWMVVITVWDSVAPPVQLMNFDAVLTALLAIAAGLYALGLQRAIDRLEIMVATVVTFFLIEGPMIVALLPEPLQILPVLLAILGVGAASVWQDARFFPDQDEQRRAMIRLGTTTLFYYLLMAAAFAIDIDVVALVNGLEQWTLSFFSIPLALLLVAARPRAEAPLSSEPPPVADRPAAPAPAD